MKMPPEHTTLLSRHDFVPTAAGDFSADERALLVKYGRWLDALARGAVEPLTDEQRRFVQVARGEQQPLSAFEVAWVKECKARASAARPRLGPLEVADRLARLSEARAAAAALQAEYNSEREAILEQVRAQLQDLDRAYLDLLRAAGDEVASRETEVREAVLQLGESAQHGSVQAVYCRGRVTWDSRGLERYAEAHPDLAEYRRIGAPSIRLRYRDEGSNKAEQPG